MLERRAGRLARNRALGLGFAAELTVSGSGSADTGTATAAVALDFGALSGLSVAAVAETSVAALDARSRAKMQGYEGDLCGECGNFTLVRNGTCMKCNTCGGTSGCS